MTKRNEHTFQFTAAQIARAAGVEAEYHEERAVYWKSEYDANIGTVEATIGAKVVRRAVTQGEELDVSVDFGDQEAWAQVRRANAKTKSHLQDAERLRTDEQLYKTQGDRSYDLDTDDVHYYRLGGGPRED